MALGGPSADESPDTPPAKWALGPPPPPLFTLLTRLLQLASLLTMVGWVFGHLGGVALAPQPVPGADAATNDTSRLFNWHPLLHALAWPVLMPEAVLAYRAPAVPSLDRPQRKYAHAALHTAAVAAAVLAVVAAFQSHNLKRPVPMANLYSAHSHLGMLTLVLVVLQWAAGMYAYLWPKMPLRQRKALMPLHRYLGRAGFVLGLATMATGIQEKATFIQNGGKSVFSPVMRLPAALVVLLALVGLFVLFHQAPPAAPGRQRRPLAEEDEDPLALPA